MKALILLLLFGTMSCKNPNECLTDKTITWTYPSDINSEVGFRILHGTDANAMPTEIIHDIAPSKTIITEYTHEFDQCICNRIAVKAYDRYNNESSVIMTSFGGSCPTFGVSRKMSEGKNRPQAPSLELE